MAQERMWWVKRGCVDSGRDVVAQEEMWWSLIGSALDF